MNRAVFSELVSNKNQSQTRTQANKPNGIRFSGKSVLYPSSPLNSNQTGKIRGENDVTNLSHQRACIVFALGWRAWRCSSSHSAPPLPTRPNKATSPRSATTSPIKHVIVIIGENRSFDHVFATYVPKSGETINNLLSEGIIELDSNKNAIPGPNFKNAQQLSATDTDSFLLAPPTQ